MVKNLVIETNEYCVPSRVLEIYVTIRKKANKQIYTVISILIGALVSALILKIAKGSEYIGWWGNIQWGVSGVVFSISIGVVVALGVRVGFYLVYTTVFLYKLLQVPMKFRLFHPDRCNGFSGLGRYVFVEWIVCFLIGTILYIVLKSGYLGVDRYFVTWVLVAGCLICVPFLAIIPLWASIYSMAKFRRKNLEIFEPSLIEAFTGLNNRDIKNQEELIRHAQAFGSLVQAFTVLKDLNVWPFNPRALASVVVLYSIQVFMILFKLHSIIK